MLHSVRALIVFTAFALMAAPPLAAQQNATVLGTVRGGATLVP